MQFHTSQFLRSSLFQLVNLILQLHQTFRSTDTSQDYSKQTRKAPHSGVQKLITRVTKCHQKTKSIHCACLQSQGCVRRRQHQNLRRSDEGTAHYRMTDGTAARMRNQPGVGLVTEWTDCWDVRQNGRLRNLCSDTNIRENQSRQEHTRYFWLGRADLQASLHIIYVWF